MGGRIRIEKLSHTLSFKKRNAPTISVMIRESSAGPEARKRKTNIGWNVTVHSQKLAHANIIESMDRIVHTADAIEWLNSQTVLEGCSLVGSLPDISEFPGYSLEKWSEWFTGTARLILSKTPPDGVSFFFQSDIKQDGYWVDKSFLVQKAAMELGRNMLFHKIVCRFPVGTITMGRPSYSHVLAFTENVKPDFGKWTADVLPDTGEKTWVRGMGLDVSMMIAQFVKDQTQTKTIVNPFCGQGSMLAAANFLGLSAVGIERSTKRAEVARSLDVSPDGKSFKVGL